jgi:hypothetical protein
MGYQLHVIIAWKNKSFQVLERTWNIPPKKLYFSGKKYYITNMTKTCYIQSNYNMSGQRKWWNPFGHNLATYIRHTHRLSN